MEPVLVGGILSTGYLLSEYGKNTRKNIQNDSSFTQPSQISIYDSDWYNKSKEIETKLVNKRYDDSRDAINTNIIPPNFNNGIINKQTNAVSYLQQPELSNNNSNNFVSSLTGLPIDKNNFTHGNMMPFFGSHVRQNNISYNNASVLENHTGVENFANSKKEPTPLFEPSKDLNIQFGTQNNTEEMLARYKASTYRQNELPFDQVLVGPGINQGFTSTPNGGFHPDIREFILPKTIDELRPKSRPQISYKGRVVSGKSINSKGTKIGNVEKYRPDTFIENTPDRLFTTVGAVTKEMSRPDMIIRDTNRICTTKEYTGVAGPAIKKNTTQRSMYKKSYKQSFKTTGPRNAFSKDSWKNEKFGDYGKQGILPVHNERQVTGTRTHISNLTSIVKALVAPVLDVMKTTRKENAEGNVRLTGNIGTSQVTKPNVYDPNDVARTTLKEQLIHDTHTGNINTTQGGKGAVLDKETMKFKTTIRETLDAEEYNLNMRVSEKGIVKDKDDIARTTTKETTIDDNHLGIMKGPVKLTVYDPNDVARTTIKETLIHDEHLGNVGGLDRGMGYTVNDMEAPNTNRQFTSDYEYEGIAKTDLGGGGGGYMTNEHEAGNTNRQFTSDYEYEGAANSMYKRPMSDSAARNMRHNPSREMTLEGRAPTQNNVKVYNGKDTINVDIKKIEGDYMNTREVAKTKVYNSIGEMKPCSITKEKKQYNDAEFMGERINPDLLSAFKQNPYTQSLSSFSY